MDERHQRSRPGPSPTQGEGAAQAGFTLIEILVSLVVMVVVLVGLLALLEFNSRVAKAQINVADMQQSLRVVQADMVRMARMAGRGGLPPRRPAGATYPGMPLPAGPAVEVQNNVPAGTMIGGDPQASVVPSTDVLTVRGVLTTPFYQVNASSDGSIPSTGNGNITVRATSPTGVTQNLQPLIDAINSGQPEGILLVSAADDAIHAVVELTGGTVSSDNVVLNLTTTNGEHTSEYLQLSPDGAYPAALTSVVALGILEEYQYYVRDGDPAPRLSRARLYPRTGAAYAGAASNLRADVADNILDLQVALGIDRDGTERIEDTQDENDDWLFNAPADDPTSALWNDPSWPLYYLRITTLARTDRIDPRYVSPAIDAIEDRVYNEPEVPAQDDRLARSYRRRQLQTVVDLRNLS